MPKHSHTHLLLHHRSGASGDVGRQAVVSVSRISDKLGATSAEPQRNTKRGTNFPYTSNALFRGAKAVGHNLSDEKKR